MAFQYSPAVCSLPAYQKLMPLSGYPPALGYCSTTAFLNKRTDRNAVNLRVPRDVPCPAGSSYMCDLLSDLKASDHDFTRNACCCIGVCLQTQSAAFVTISATTPTAAVVTPTFAGGNSTTSLTPSVSSITTSSASPNTVTSPTSDASTSSASVSSSIATRTFASAPRGSSSTVASSTSVSSSSTSSSVSSTSNLGTSSSSSTSPSSSSSSSSSTATCPKTITTDPACTVVTATGGQPATYTEYFAGQYVIEDVNNPGNDNNNYPPMYTALPGTLDTCDALNDCANFADPTNDNAFTLYYSFDLHYLASNSTWECVAYYDPNTDSSYFNISDPDACLTFGFAQPVVGS